MEASTSSEAVAAYNYGVATYNDFRAAQASGASVGEAAGKVGGVIGGAAACTALGAPALAPVCGSIGGALGGIVGGAIGGLFSAETDLSDAVCDALASSMHKLDALSKSKSLGITPQQRRFWFVDAATRAALAPYGWTIRGEMGQPGAAAVSPDGVAFQLGKTGLPLHPEGISLQSPTGFSVNGAAAWRLLALWAPTGSHCMMVDIPERVSGRVKSSAAIGVAAVSARFELRAAELTQRSSPRRLHPRTDNSLLGWAVGAGVALAYGGWRYLRRGKRG